jgi:restriction system protein
MKAWLIRAGRDGQDEGMAIEQGIAVIGWEEMPDLSSVTTFEDMKRRHGSVYPDLKPAVLSHGAGQLWAFAKRIETGDIAVLPLKSRRVVAVGRVAGPYEYRRGRHVRRVEWIRPDVPRTLFRQDLLYTLGAFMTVCEISRNQALRRLQAILDGGKDPGFGQPEAPGETAVPDIDGEARKVVDLEEQAQDQIHALITTRFKGHELALLVEAILKAQGYKTQRSPAGADGGVDILAGGGPMGLERPRLCVQVKSGGVQGDAAVRELEGAMGRTGAEQGLFVSWDGFTKPALDQVRNHYFKLRLWDDSHLMAALLEAYDRLPGEVRAEIPLKRIWAVVPDEDD